MSGLLPFRFRCHRCARCCSGGAGYVWVEEHELAALALELRASEAALRERFLRRALDPRTGRERWALREEGRGEGGRCVFLRGHNECSVYAARPAHCRQFPYWPSVLAEREAFESARATCPGIAVVAAPELRARAFAALERLYAELPPPQACAPGACCLEREPDALFASALEADHAAERGQAAGDSCRLGRARPLACRLRGADAASAEAARERLRALERELDYPAGYGRLADLLEARAGGESAGEGDACLQPQGAPRQ